MTKLAERLFQLLSEEKPENLVLGSDLTSVAIDGLFNLVRVTQGLADWQPIETAPKDGDFLVSDGKFVAHASRETDADGCSYWDIMGYKWPAPFDNLGITRWTPLPDPPKD